MPWARAGDTSGMYPRLMAAAALPDAPDGAYPMMFGFVTLLATMSAAAKTDYVVDAGTVRFCGGEQHRWLLAAALTTGLLSKVRGKVHGVQAYKLIDDPDFLHIRLKAEIEWENQQRSDTKDLRLAIPVRARDGDLCRYCAVIVHWAGPKSPRKATMDHTAAKNASGERQPATVDTMVVACLGCNSEMRDAAGEDRAPLLDPPATPFYGKSTAAWLTKNGRPTLATDGSERRPAHAVTDLPSSRPSGVQDQHHDPPPESPPLSLIDQVEQRDSAGTGRGGAGNAPLLGSDYPRNPAGTPRRKRAPRGGRNRNPEDHQ